MFEFSGCRKVIGPSLCPPGQLIIPAKRRNTSERAFAVVARKKPVVQAAKPRLRTRQQCGSRCKKRNFARRLDEPLHAKSPRNSGTLRRRVLKQRRKLWLIRR